MPSKFEYGRVLVQVGVGSYMLLYPGILMGENMQIEGFWYYLFLGTFQSAVIHYFVAKIFGPLFFGRGWCGYACWTSMVLDMLPYRISEGRRHGRRKIKGTECILCMRCVFSRPAGALHI